MNYKNEIYALLGAFDNHIFYLHFVIDNYDKNINKKFYEYISKYYDDYITLGIYDVHVQLFDDTKILGYDFLFYKHNNTVRNIALNTDDVEFVTKSILEKTDDNEIILYKKDINEFEVCEDQDIQNEAYKLLRCINKCDCIEVYYI